MGLDRVSRRQFVSGLAALGSLPLLPTGAAAAQDFAGRSLIGLPP